MADSGDEFFYNNFIELSTLEDSSDDDTNILVATLDHFERQQTKFRGSIPRHASALNRNRESFLNTTVRFSGGEVGLNLDRALIVTTRRGRIWTGQLSV